MICTALLASRKIVVKLSTRPEKRIGSDEMWDRAEADLAVALEENNIPFEYQLGEGAFLRSEN